MCETLKVKPKKRKKTKQSCTVRYLCLICCVWCMGSWKPEQPNSLHEKENGFEKWKYEKVDRDLWFGNWIILRMTKWWELIKAQKVSVLDRTTLGCCGTDNLWKCAESLKLVTLVLCGRPRNPMNKMGSWDQICSFVFGCFSWTKSCFLKVCSYTFSGLSFTFDNFTSSWQTSMFNQSNILSHSFLKGKMCFFKSTWSD